MFYWLPKEPIKYFLSVIMGSALRGLAGFRKVEKRRGLEPHKGLEADVSKVWERGGVMGQTEKGASPELSFWTHISSSSTRNPLFFFFK